MPADKVPGRTKACDEPAHPDILARKRKNKFGKYEYDPKFAEIALETLAGSDEAKTKAHVCAALQCSKDTLLKWQKLYPDFDIAIKEGLRLGEAKWRAKIREHAFEPSSTVNNGLIKLLSANVYGIKEEPQVVINNQQGTQNIITDEMSANQAAQAYADMMKGEE